MRGIPITSHPVVSLLACAGLAACTTLPDGSLLPAQLSRPDEVEVTELRGLTQCAAPTDAIRIETLADAEAVQAWQHARGIDLIGSEPLPDGPFAVIDLGSRPDGGYGIAISRRAELRGPVLRLTASFLRPHADDAPAPGGTSPCVLVGLPAGPYARVELADPAGRRRAVTATTATPR